MTTKWRGISQCKEAQEAQYVVCLQSLLIGRATDILQTVLVFSALAHYDVTWSL